MKSRRTEPNIRADSSKKGQEPNKNVRKDSQTLLNEKRNVLKKFNKAFEAKEYTSLDYEDQFGRPKSSKPSRQRDYHDKHGLQTSFKKESPERKNKLRVSFNTSENEISPTRQSDRSPSQRSDRSSSRQSDRSSPSRRIDRYSSNHKHRSPTNYNHRPTSSHHVNRSSPHKTSSRWSPLRRSDRSSSRHSDRSSSRNNSREKYGRREQSRSRSDERYNRDGSLKYYNTGEDHKKLSKKQLRDAEFNWQTIETLRSVPPSDYTITHINQTHDLQRLEDLKMAPNANLDSIQWLEAYSLESMKLTLKDLLAKGTVSKPVSDKTGKAIQHISFDALDVNEFEYKLNLSLEMYSKRIRWLLQSSRRSFGLVQGEKIAVIIDSSNANMGFGRAIELQDSLLNLLTEQLTKKKQFYFSTFGTQVNELWDTSLKDIHHRSIEEAKIFVTQMKPLGGTNLLGALKKCFAMNDIDSVVIILGSVPDQNMEMIVDYLHQIILNKPSVLHFVSYELNNHIVNSALRKLAEETNGRFHCFSNTQEVTLLDYFRFNLNSNQTCAIMALLKELIYNSTDISILLKEIQRAQELLNKIKDMKKGMLGSAIVQIENEINMEIEKYPDSKFLPRPRGHDLPLCIEQKAVSGRDSLTWIQSHGLKAKKLNLYQVLAPNAYSFVEDYVPILNKNVQSQVHEKAMIQFYWHDGTIKNLHVDLATLYDFQKRLKETVKLYEKRIDWLSNESRKIFGSIAEDSVVILVDLSIANANYLIHIQHSLRLLMEQQISNKKYFNIIGFGRTIKRWKPTVVKPTTAMLQDAWKWVLDLQCEGTRNVMGALKAALENEEERKHSIEIEGLYLFTSGVPDQSIETLCSYIEESACGANLRCHTILFNVDDYDMNGPIPGRWANITKTAESLRMLAHCLAGGRFHWFRETGIIESDDLKLIQQEIDKAVDFSHKAAELVERIKRKSEKETLELNLDDEDEDSENEMKAIQPKQQVKALPPPKQTLLSLQRMSLRDKEQEEEASKQKALPWRPNSSKTELVPLPGRDGSRTRTTSSSKSQAKVEPFYMGTKDNAKGSVFIQYPRPKSTQKAVPIVAISDKEENMTTKEWLKRYSLSKLKLDLHKLVSGPECKHDTVVIGKSKKEITARYCSTFPSININGTVRHLQLKPGELLEYQDQCEKVLKRYVKRLQWLLSGSRRLFGTFVHDRIVILIDTSGSMDENIDELRKELAGLVWDQLYKYNIKFNFVCFSDYFYKWREQIVEPTEENCHEAIAWIASLKPYGNTCTLDVLKEVFEDDEINAIYMITDGKPDTSTSLVLDEVRKMNAHRHLSINVVSFYCEEKSANDFLSQLAAENNGRFHKTCKNDRDIHLFAHKILTEGVSESYLSHIPDFEGDDLRKLANEINKAKQFLKQAITFNKMYDRREKFNEEVLIGPIHISNVNDQEARHKGCVPCDFLL